jgi:hypothetical protein
MSSGGGVTQIDTTYLDSLKSYLEEVQSWVDQQIKGMGTTGVGPNTASYLQAVSGATSVDAGTASFEVAGNLNTALKSMGTSVSQELGWLNKTVSAMISEITTTVAKFQGTESLNNDTVQQLISDFQNTISDMNTPPGSGSSSSSSST